MTTAIRIIFATACCLVVAAFVGAAEAGLALPSAQPGGDTVSHPSFILFFTDDQGWQDLSCQGHPYLKTPNLDRLAKEGTRFQQFYSCASVCSPSRTAFMTGQYPARHRIHQHLWIHRHNKHLGMPDFLDPAAVTVTRLLRKAGYRTGHFGKWHLGSTPDAPAPSAYGIDDHRVCVGNGPGWDRTGKRTVTDIAHASYNNCTERDSFWTHSTDLIVDEAIAFLERNKGKPFYINLWTLLPHAPNKPTRDQLELYEDLQARPEDLQSWMREYAEDAKDFESQMKVYCGVMSNIDSALGRLLEKLDELKLADNTLILFTSDNGPEDYHIKNVRHSGMGATGPLRGRKRSLYEGGIRMPCIARWPGRIPSGRVDRLSVIAAVDWLPTVCSLSGVKLPDFEPDGEDVSDILLGKERPRENPLFWEWRGGVVGNKAYRSPNLAIRDGDWKLFASPDGKDVELYHIPKDPDERNNLAREQPDVVEELLPAILQWKNTLPDSH